MLHLAAIPGEQLEVVAERGVAGLVHQLLVIDDMAFEAGLGGGENVVAGWFMPRALALLMRSLRLSDLLLWMSIHCSAPPWQDSQLTAVVVCTALASFS